MSPWRVAAVVVALLASVLVVLAPAATVHVVVFVVAAAVALGTLRRARPLRAELLVRAVLLLGVAAGVVVPALIGVVELGSRTLDGVVDPRTPQSAGDLAAVTLVVAALLLVAVRWPSWLGRRGEIAFVVLAVLGATGLKLLYVHAMTVPPLSDFAEMWKLSSTIAERGIDAARQPLGSYFYRWAYFERTLPYLLPLRLAFGPDPSSYSVANVVLGAASSLLVYAMTRWWFGARAARVALVVSLLAVETVLAAEIPTHDIPGAFLTVLGIALFALVFALQAQGRLPAAAAASLAVGVVAVVLDLQRSIGGVLLLAASLLGLGLLLVERRRPLPALLLIALPWLVLAGGNRALRHEALRMPQSLQSYTQGLGLAAGTDSWGDGSFQHAIENYTIPYNTLPVEWSSLAVAKLATDTYYHPAGRVTSYLRKARGLFDLGSQTIFYLNAAQLQGEGALDEVCVARLRTASRWFSLLFVAALARGAWFVARSRRVQLAALLPLVFLAVFTLILLLSAEVQPRYLYPIWYLGAIYVGALLGGAPGTATATPKPVSP